MKLRAVLDLDVPDHVGEAILKEQKDRHKYRETLVLPIKIRVDEHNSYHDSAPIHWEPIDR
jgi:hypothetical protein